MKIYLAGKISGDNWRSQIIPNYDAICSSVLRNYKTGKSWPVTREVLPGGHDFTGPYSVGYSYCDTHGAGKHLGEKMAEDIVKLCQQAIKSSDLVFAWITSTDVYATLFEIGIAVGIGIPVVLGSPKIFDDMWFIYESVSDVWRGNRDSPKDAYDFAVGNYHSLFLKYMPYDEYLKTPHWQKVRELAIERASGKCQVCNSTKNLNAHHRNYSRRGDEQAEDIIVLCRDCHKLFHQNGKLKNNVGAKQQ